MLHARRFTADDVGAASGAVGQTLTNYITRTNLRLVSESPGRGKPRPFPLIDAYQVSLMHVLVKASGSMQWGAYATNSAMFGIGADFIFEADASELRTMAQALMAPNAPATDDEAEQRRLSMFDKIKRMADDPAAWPEEYRDRDRASPWFLVAELDHKGIWTGGETFRPPHITKKPVDPLNGGIWTAGIIVNLTSLFNDVDACLTRRIQATEQK